MVAKNLLNKARRFFFEVAMSWQEMLQKLKHGEVPEIFLRLLEATKKSEQEALLKGAILTPDILMGLFIRAEAMGYTLSNYSSEYAQKGVDPAKMPLAYGVQKDGNVKVFGNTELSNGQLKQAVEHRKVKMAKFLDKGNTWHCFFTIYKSLRGDETWLGEKQPHYHYISNTFGIDRAEVVAQIKSEKYKLGNLPHIKLEEYGNQPD